MQMHLKQSDSVVSDQETKDKMARFQPLLLSWVQMHLKGGTMKVTVVSP
jgi:hypothetical protein